MREKAMTLGQLKEHLERVYTINGGAAVVAITPHGSYTFDVVAVEDELSRAAIVLRLQEVIEPYDGMTHVPAPSFEPVSEPDPW